MLICCIRFFFFFVCVIARFVSIATSSTFDILSHLIYSCFDMISPYGVDFTVIRRFSVFLWSFPFLATSTFPLWDVSCLSLKTSILLFFFSIKFSLYFRSVDHCVFSIVYGGCYQSFSMPLYVVFKSCLDASMLSSMWQVLLFLLFSSHNLSTS